MSFATRSTRPQKMQRWVCVSWPSGSVRLPTRSPSPNEPPYLAPQRTPAPGKTNEDIRKTNGHIRQYRGHLLGLMGMGLKGTFVNYRGDLLDLGKIKSYLMT